MNLISIMRTTFLLLMLVVTLVPARAADNLKLNPKLDYNSDSADGPLITGENMDAGLAVGRPNYVIFFGEECYNSKRQARRTRQACVGDDGNISHGGAVGYAGGDCGGLGDIATVLGRC